MKSSGKRKGILQPTTTTILRSLYRSTCNWRILLKQFYCPHAPADNNQRIRIREKMLELSSTHLTTSFPGQPG